MRGRKVTKPPTKSDLQSRLRYISEASEKIQTEAGNKADRQLSELAYLVSYLAGIVEKHFREDEK